MVNFYLDQGDGKVVKPEVPAEVVTSCARRGIPDDYQPPPLFPEELKRIDICRAGICLDLSNLLYAIDEDKPFDRTEYIELAASAYDVPEEDLVGVLEVGEKRFGKENHLRLIDYVGLHFEGEGHKTDGKTFEEIAKYFRDMEHDAKEE